MHRTVPGRGALFAISFIALQAAAPRPVHSAPGPAQPQPAMRAEAGAQVEGVGAAATPAAQRPSTIGARGASLTAGAAAERPAAELPRQLAEALATVPPPRATGVGRVIVLDEAYRLASQHPALKAAEEGVAQAELLHDRLMTFWKPQISAVGTYTHFDNEITMGFPDFGSMNMVMIPEEVLRAFNPEYEGGPVGLPDFSSMKSSEIVLQKQDSFAGILQFQWPLFSAPLIKELGTAEQVEEMTRLQVLHQRRSFLMAPVALTYYSALAARDSLDVSRRRLETVMTHFEATQRLFEVGQGTRLTVLQAALSAVDASQKVRQADTALGTALRTLELLLGVQGPIELERPAAPPLPMGGEQDLLRLAMQRRQDVRAADVAVQVAERNRDKFWTQFVPSLAATGHWRVSDSENFAGDKASWQVGLALNVPLYDGGARYVERNEALSKLRQAEEQRTALHQQIAAELSEKLRALREAEAGLVTTQQALELAREGAAAAQASFQVGMVSNLDVLDANQQLYEAEQGLVGIKIMLAVARLQLAHVVGAFTPMERAQPTPPAGGGPP